MTLSETFPYSPWLTPIFDLFDLFESWEREDNDAVTSNTIENVTRVLIRNSQSS